MDITTYERAQAIREALRSGNGEAALTLADEFVAWIEAEAEAEAEDWTARQE